MFDSILGGLFGALVDSLSQVHPIREIDAEGRRGLREDWPKGRDEYPELVPGDVVARLIQGGRRCRIESTTSSMRSPFMVVALKTVLNFEPPGLAWT